MFPRTRPRLTVPSRRGGCARRHFSRLSEEPFLSRQTQAGIKPSCSPPARLSVCDLCVDYHDQGNLHFLFA
ncbi:hypothetical protein J6590_016854 [Homalodisca vitripennis]|nr:hypothetical protein J6590_016854 [Homalodisca vitripennis]